MELTPHPDTEKYLFTDFNLIEDITLLTNEGDIETFFTDNTELLGDRQDGFSDYEEFIIKIGNDYYDVEVDADVYNLGGNDDLWACDVTEVRFYKREKPLPLERRTVTITMNVTDEVFKYIREYIDAKGCEVTYVKR